MTVSLASEPELQKYALDIGTGARLTSFSASSTTTAAVFCVKV